MDDRPLELKTLSELRGIAQAVGLTLDWSWDKRKLTEKIRDKIRPTVDGAPTISDTPSDSRFRTLPPARNLPQHEVARALDKYKEQGLVYTFPTKDTVRLTITVTREDSCSLRVPLRTLVNCARKLVNG